MLSSTRAQLQRGQSVGRIGASSASPMHGISAKPSTVAAISHRPARCHAEAQHVDRVNSACATELMAEDQLAIAVDADDDRVRRERSERLGKRAPRSRAGRPRAHETGPPGIRHGPCAVAAADAAADQRDDCDVGRHPQQRPVQPGQPANTTGPLRDVLLARELEARRREQSRRADRRRSAPADR